LNRIPIGVPRWRWPLPEEPAHGLLLHLVERNGYSSTKLVAECLGVRLSELRFGDVRSLSAFARMIRCPVDRFTSDCPIRMSEGERTDRGIVNDNISRALSLKLRDVPISRAHLLGREIRRACPACLAESMHHRFWWDLRPVTTCPRHKLRLVDRCGCDTDNKLSWRDDRIFSCKSCGSRSPMSMARRQAEPEIIDVDRYALKRFGIVQAPAVPILDSMSVSDAWETMERVGAAAIGGYSKTWHGAVSLGAKQENLLAKGFAILSTGGLPALLQMLLDGFREQAPSFVEPALTTAYGWFYHWFNFKGGRRLSEMMAEEIARHAQSNFHLATPFRLALEGRSRGDRGGGRSGSGDSLRLPQSYSLRAAAEELKLPKSALRRYGTALGLVREEARKGYVLKFDGPKLRALAADLRGAVNLKQAANILGVEYFVFRGLIAAGILKPIIPVSENKSNSVYVFRISDIEALSNGVLGGAPLVSDASAAMVGPSEARVAYHISHVLFYSLILEKRLDVIGRKSGKRGMSAVLVDRTDLRKSLLALAEREDVGIGVCGAIIRSHGAAVSAMAAAGLLKTRGPDKAVPPLEVEANRREEVVRPRLSRKICRLRRGNGDLGTAAQ
jgi:hypothetical protein